MRRAIFITVFGFIPFLLNGQDAKNEIGQMLDNWHLAAAQANFEGYFGYMAEESIFIGTDATENWTLTAFKEFSKPYFDRGKAWSFTAVQRNIYLSSDGNTAWFDELLNTQMKLCRGSGVVKKVNGEWKIAHYVLSIAIPNENVNEVVKLKQVFDDSLIQQLPPKKF